MKIAIIGGGLAGLTAAAYLSVNPNVEGVLFERSPQLGGRAFTYRKAGFTLNYGAHAVYGIDRHTLMKMQQELDLKFSSKQVDKRKVVYRKDEVLTPAPLDLINIMKTDILPPMKKVKFMGEVAAIVAHRHSVRNYATFGDYLDKSNASEDIKQLWSHLVCSNFFMAPEDARNVSGEAVADYYHNLFLSSKPVNYILGSWEVITEQLQDKINHSGRWNISLKDPIESITEEKGQFLLKSKNSDGLIFDAVIVAIPVQQAAKLLEPTPWGAALQPYAMNTATEVMVYDLGLSKIVARPFHYISDMENKLFISDVSATDPSVAPEGGQLLQGIAYLKDDVNSDGDRKEYLDSRSAGLESLFNQYYPGWQDHIEVKRVSRKAMVTSVKNVVNNQLLPTTLPGIPFSFCGDGCLGQGELAERAFSSARQVAKDILAKLEKTPVPVS